MQILSANGDRLAFRLEGSSGRFKSTPQARGERWKFELPDEEEDPLFEMVWSENEEGDSSDSASDRETTSEVDPPQDSQGGYGPGNDSDGQQGM